jgi:hypothetical protein
MSVSPLKIENRVCYTENVARTLFLKAQIYESSYFTGKGAEDTVIRITKDQKSRDCILDDGFALWAIDPGELPESGTGGRPHPSVFDLRS